ncbi:MAG: Ig-like domain-containing protein, partial [archaeon]|nr:Ig-like domain-containing protein [archaeon]
NATVSLTVGKVNVGVDVKVDSIVYGDDAVVDVVVNGVSGKVVPEGNVTFYINGIENGTVHINDGKCKYIFSDLSVSIYTINVVYSGDNNYLSSNATVSLTVGKVNVGVDVKVDSIVYGETAAIDVTVKGINDKIVPTGNVTLFVNGTGNITVPINDGKCNYIFSNLSAGIYNILVFYGGDDKYSYSFVAVSLTVGKVNVGVDVKVDSIVYGSDAVVDVVVKGIDGKLVPTGEVIFFVNDIKKGNVPINDGKCDFILSDLGAGIYNVSVVYSGDNNYLSSNVTTNLTVNPINVTLIPTVLTTDYDSGKYFQIKVVDNNNESITGLKLALKVFTGSSYKTVYVTTDDNRIAKYDASKLSIGTHNVTVMVSNSNYSASIKTSSIKIVKAATKITNVSTKVIKNHKYFYVKLTTKSGKALANKVVTMKSSVSGKKYKIKTNSKGIAKIDLWITYNLGKTHKYTFKYAGNSYYKAYSVTFKIKLVK